MVFPINSFGVIHSYAHIGDKLVDKCEILIFVVNCGTEAVNNYFC